ncbi:protein HGH1 homolog isoform X2 [Dysidea avara]|uniref:protein HGH1 homolog isoform X2 n=1 Tax=Dysidea avara TaxID=196820 RepID=UPI003325E150
MDEVSQLAAFLKKDVRMDLKVSALSYVLGLTASPDGLECILKHRKVILPAILELTEDDLEAVENDSYLSLVNIAADTTLARELISLHVIPKLLGVILNLKCGNHVVMVISNLTQSSEGSKTVLDVLQDENSTINLHQLINVFCTNRAAKFHYMATVFSNISQLLSGRKLFLDRQQCLLQRLLPFIHYQDSLIRRGGIVGLVRNLCFETAGSEEISEDEMEGLPEDLQYLGDDKKREEDPDIRKMLIESVMQLCSTREGRLYIKKKHTYIIMRELHKWEKDTEVSTICHKCIDILIADEPESGMHNLQEVKLPEKFKAQ